MRILMIGLFMVTLGYGQVTRLLVFSKTAGFRHSTIDEGIAMISELGQRYGFEVDASEDESVMTAGILENYAAVIFLHTTGNFLNAQSQEALEGYIQNGGGWLGIHAAADAENQWGWYGGLLGGNAYFESHPARQTATIVVEDGDHPSTQHLGETWERFDEWYNFDLNPRPSVNVLLTLDEASYSGGNMGGDHPIAWWHDYDGGRSFYTGLGHTEASYSEPDFRAHILGGIFYTAGIKPRGPVRDGTAIIAPKLSYETGAMNDLKMSLPDFYVGQLNARLEKSTLLTTGSWTLVEEPVVFESGEAIVTIEMPMGLSQNFFRVVYEAP